MAADLDPRDLAEVRRRVVDPVVRSVICPEELDDIVLYTEDDLVYVRVTARGELVTWCSLGLVSDGTWDARATADNFYGVLADELPSTTFGWGQEREGRYEVPGPIAR